MGARLYQEQHGIDFSAEEKNKAQKEPTMQPVQSGLLARERKANRGPTAMSQPVRNAEELPAVGTPVERPVGRLAPERADGSEHYWDDRDEEFEDDPVCPCCGGDGMDPMTDYALPCPECGYGE